MQVAANVILALLIPITLLTAVALRDTRRLHGPDVMGPAFYFIVSLVLRWVLATVGLGLLVASGVFDGLVGIRAVQVLGVYALFFAADCAAAAGVMVFAPRSSVSSPGVKALAGVVGYGLPAGLIVLFWVIQGVGPVAGLTRGLLAAAFVVAVVCVPFFMRQVKLTREAEQNANAEWYARQRQRIAEGTGQLNAMPADVPVEELLPYLVDDWPTEVRAVALDRLRGRLGLDHEIIAMLSDDRRRLAMAYMAQSGETPSEAVAKAAVRAAMEMARAWEVRGAGLTKDEVEKLVGDCGRCVEMAYRCREAAVDFRPVMAVWAKGLEGVGEVDGVLLARGSVDVWRREHPGEGVAEEMNVSGGARNSPSLQPSPEGRGGRVVP